MKKLLLLFLFSGLLHMGYSQKERPIVKNVADIKGAVVKKEQGEFTDANTGKSTGSYVVTYVIDTIQQQLLQVTIVNRERGREFIYLFHYSQNKLTQASSGFIENGLTNIYQTYAYDEEDFKLKEKDLETLVQTDEKYALLKESKRYLNVLKKM